MPLPRSRVKRSKSTNRAGALVEDRPRPRLTIVLNFADHIWQVLHANLHSPALCDHLSGRRLDRGGGRLRRRGRCRYGGSAAPVLGLHRLVRHFTGRRPGAPRLAASAKNLRVLLGVGLDLGTTRTILEAFAINDMDHAALVANPAPAFQLLSWSAMVTPARAVPSMLDSLGVQVPCPD